jgi:hypothetical protein
MIMPLKFRLPKDIPMSEYPRPEAYLEEGRLLTNEAQKQGIILRVMGPIALHYYFPKYVDLYSRMERLGERVFTDIDYASYGKHRGKLVPFFESHGYELEKRAAMVSGGTRLIFFSSRIPMIDVFFDKLDYNHPIDYRGRLENHPYCVSLADLMLQKLQIVQINDKDLKDAMLLLLAAPLGESDKDEINAKYISRLFSDDWGFYYTATNNLRKIKRATEAVKALSAEQCQLIVGKVDEFLQIIETAPKSGKWKGRAKVGEKKLWYKEVSDWV